MNSGSFGLPERMLYNIWRSRFLGPQVFKVLPKFLNIASRCLIIPRGLEKSQEYQDTRRRIRIRPREVSVPDLALYGSIWWFCLFSSTVYLTMRCRYEEKFNFDRCRKYTRWYEYCLPPQRFFVTGGISLNKSASINNAIVSFVKSEGTSLSSLLLSIPNQSAFTWMFTTVRTPTSNR